MPWRYLLFDPKCTIYYFYSTREASETQGEFTDLSKYAEYDIIKTILTKEVYTMSQVTKRALEASLKNLLLQKPLNKITINDIADDCGINRMTFYYHFKDIYDLVEWSCQEDAGHALAGKKTYETWQQGLCRSLKRCRRTSPLF